jgi:hypothetical protein
MQINRATVPSFQTRHKKRRVTGKKALLCVNAQGDDEGFIDGARCRDANAMISHVALVKFWREGGCNGSCWYWLDARSTQDRPPHARDMDHVSIHVILLLDHA